jgi:hypothetical protein
VCLIIEECIKDLQQWMIHSRLQLNPQKTEYLPIISSRLESSLRVLPLQVGTTSIEPSTVVRNLGVMMDRHLNMQAHISHVCRTCYFHLRNIGRIRKCLTKESAATLVHSLVASRIDYGNSLLYGLPNSLLSKLQRILNTAARIVSLSSRFDPISPILKDLHWLKIKQRAEFKLLVLTFKSLHGMAPSYTQELIQPYTPSRALRSQDSNLLTVPRNKLQFGDRAFSIAAPSLWNCLPQDIKSAPSLHTFRKRLKTHLFAASY